MPRNRDLIPHGVLAAVLVVAGVLALEGAYGVALGDALLYLGYELVFVITPGWLVYSILTRHRGGALRQLTMGWALGYVLEIFTFMLTAATGTRSVFVLYPVVLGVAAGARLYGWRSQPQTQSNEESSTRFELLFAGVCMAVATAFAVAYNLAPLPGTESVKYFQDDTWHLALAADVKHHWPLLDPNVSGDALPYHYFVHLHLAAASHVTGLELPLVYWRLFTIPLIQSFSVPVRHGRPGPSWERSNRAHRCVPVLLRGTTNPRPQPVGPVLGGFLRPPRQESKPAPRTSLFVLAADDTDW